MSGPSDTGGRPLASTIQNYQQQQQQQHQHQHQQQLDPTSILPTSPHIKRRKASQTSDERIGGTKSINSRRRPGTAKEASFGPQTGSSRGQTSMMQRSTMSPSNMSPEAAAVHYTRTGRISKAKKGLKVHNCECGKSYTRAEHLRRHQKNHAQNALHCEFPDCGKTFYRPDLLQRHQERHNEIGKDSRQPSIFSPRGTAEESQPSPPAELPTVMTTLPPASPYYPQQAISPVPESASNISHSKQRSSYPTRQSIAVPVSVDGLQTNIPWSEPYSQSPIYSSSSGYASPVPGPGDFANMFANPPYGPGSNRTRTSSNASFVEPWAYPSRSPTSATSTMAYTWTSNDKSPAPSNLAFMATSYPMTSVPMVAGVDPLYGHFGPKTMAQRDEGEQAILFPEQAYGMGQLEHTYPFEQYLDNYWRFFHPSFPVVHRTTFDGMSQSPMLRAAMIAVGGQYSNDASVKRKSRILHDRCMKLLEQRDLDVVTEPERLCDDQALFLIEVLSQYRARRAANTLSPRFGTVYHKVTENFRIIASQINTITQQPQNATHEQWTQWIELASQQRLLLCCYILEYQQAIHLARESPQSLIPFSGLDLPFPAHSSIWDATNPSDWAVAVQQRAHLPTYVYDVTPNLNTGQLDSFQSSLLIAAYYNHFGNPAPYLAPPFVTNIEHLLDSSPLTKHNLLVAKLLQVTPIRALLAVPGESWVLSEKVPSPQGFGELKATLRTWIGGLWTSPAPESHNPPGKDALKYSIEILQQAINASPHTFRLNMGADMGLYFAALVIWAVTVAASTRINTSSQGTHLRNLAFPPYTPHSSNRTSSHYTPSTPTRPHALLTPNSSASLDLTQPATIGLVPSQRTSPAPLTPHSTTSILSHSETIQTSMNFLSTALVELDFLGLIPQWPREVSDWQTGCASLLRWLKTKLRESTSEGRDSVTSVVPGMGTGGDGLGELLDGVVGVLEKMMGRGWEGWGI